MPANQHNPKGDTRGAQLSRVPPHDLGIEEALLGAGMLNPVAAAVVAETSADAFYKPAHAHIAQAVGDLHRTEQRADPALVASLLSDRGLLDSIGGAHVLTELQNRCPATSNAHHYAERILLLRRRRQIIGLCGEIVESVYSGLDPSGLTAQLAVHAQPKPQARWEAANMAAVLAGESSDEPPSQLERTDQQPLLYRHKIHLLFGEPESAKTWIALLAVLQALNNGQHAALIDLEDSPAVAANRLLALGATPTQLVERFHYIRPDGPLDAHATASVANLVEATSAAVCVIDSMAELLAANGWDSNSETDVLHVFDRLARPAANQGAAVTIIDHTPKDAEGRHGRYSRGSGAKLAAINGVSYRAEVVRPFAPNRHGISRLHITKDRPGHIRDNSQTSIAGDFHLDSTGPASRAWIEPHLVQEGGTFEPTALMERVSRWLELQPQPATVRAIRDGVKGKAAYIDQAIAILADRQHITPKPPYRSIAPYRETPVETEPEW